MTAPDSSAIDAALLLKLQLDAPLAALLPDGVWFDQGPAGLTRYGRVTLAGDIDEPIFGGRAWEDATYAIEAIERCVTTGLNTGTAPHVGPAAARIDQLLELGTLSLPGYGLLVLRRVGRTRSIEVDPTDATIRWAHRGGRYQLVAALAASA